MREISPLVPRSRIEERACLVCGTRFKANNRGRKRVYCSEKCLNAASYRRRKAEGKREQ